MRGIKKIFSRSPRLQREQLTGKYLEPFFKDTSIQQEILRKGFAVRNLLSTESIQLLKNAFQSIEQHPDAGIKDEFWNSGRCISTEVRMMARRAIDQHVKPSLEALFLPDKMDLMGGVFVAKPPGPKTALNPHQDSSHVEEVTFCSLYAWTALDDTNELNGPVHVVPGSHLFGNHQRSLNIPWQFEPYTDVLWEYAEPVFMKAGEVLFFDSASIHCSPPNQTEALRLGVNFFVKPLASPFLHYYQEATNLRAPIEKFSVGINFYYEEDFMQRPPAKYPLFGVEKYNDLFLDKGRVRSLCEEGQQFAVQI
jgi:hypothetical protein